MLTTEEREIEAMKKIQPFKARPVSAVVMASSGDRGVPKVPKRELTRPKEFTFNTQKQAVKRAATERGAESPVTDSAPTFTACSSPIPSRLHSRRKRSSQQDPVTKAGH